MLANSDIYTPPGLQSDAVSTASTTPDIGFRARYDGWNSTLVRQVLFDPGLAVIDHPEPSFVDSLWGGFVQELNSGDSPVYFSVSGTREALRTYVTSVLEQTPAASRDRPGLNFYLRELEKKLHYMSRISGSEKLNLTLRNHFWGTDCIWHFDRLPKDAFPGFETGIRMNWSVGRPRGMRVTSLSNVRAGVLVDLFRGNEQFLTQLYQHAERVGQAQASEDLLKLPGFLRLLACQDRGTLLDPAAIIELPADCVSIHKVEGAVVPKFGTPHCLSIENKDQPGLQTIITAPFKF